jgi:hypothetical protein
VELLDLPFPREAGRGPPPHRTAALGRQTLYGSAARGGAGGAAPPIGRPPATVTADDDGSVTAVDGGLARGRSPSSGGIWRRGGRSEAGSRSVARSDGRTARGRRSVRGRFRLHGVVLDLPQGHGFGC